MDVSGCVTSRERSKTVARALIGQLSRLIVAYTEVQQDSIAGE